MRLARLGLAVFMVLVLGLTQVLPAFADGPSAVPLAPSTVHFWVWYDKLYDGYPNGRYGPGTAWNGTYLKGDGAWQWAYGGPQYTLTTLTGKFVSQGYPDEDLELTLPGDGSYLITLSPPTGMTPTGRKWQMAAYCKYANMVTVMNGKVSVYQYGLVLDPVQGKYITGWKYTGDQVLAGIIDTPIWWGQ